MTRAEEKRLQEIRDALAAGKSQRMVLGLVCRLLQCPMPEITKVRKAAGADVSQGRVREVTGEPAAPWNPARQQPKPDPRREDEDALARFRRMVCAVRDVDCWVISEDHPSDAHHLIRRSAGGDDADGNLLPLCRGHHTGRLGWHTLRPWPWFKRFAARLSEQDRLKVQVVLNLAKVAEPHQ